MAPTREKYALLKKGTEAVQAFWDKGLVGRALLQEHTRVVDDFVCSLFAAAANGFESPRGISLVALGGYGRKDLFPFSDLDLMLLFHPSMEDRVEDMAEHIFYPLWDSGREVGHGVRTIKECMEQAQKDFFFQVSLLDMRHLCGDETLTGELASEFQRKFIEGKRREFVHKMQIHREERHKRFGSHVYLLEPNIKESRGGLRDLQAVLWIANVLYGLSGLQQLEEAGIFTKAELDRMSGAWDNLIKVRNRLHFVSNRKNDRLFFEYQEQIAKLSGHLDKQGVLGVEHFMREVYENLQTIAIYSDLFFEHVEETVRQPRSKAQAKALEPGLEVINGRIHFSDPSLIDKKRVLLMKPFAYLATDGTPLYHRTRRIITEKLDLIEERQQKSSRMAAVFFQALAGKYAGDALTAMLNTGLLVKYIPEFNKIRSLAQYDIYHIYSVDRHSIETVRVLHSLKDTHSHIFQEIKEPIVLFLAGLLHDIGKGRGGKHALIGAPIAEEIGKRLHLGDKKVQALRFLVENHLYLMKMATRRDLDDEGLIIKCARVIKDRDLLNMLYLLSIADAKATGPTVWNEWKGALLLDLYLKVSHLLERTDLVDPDRVKAVQWMLDQIRGCLGDKAGKELCQLPEDYLLSFTPEAICHHLELKKGLENKAFVMEVEDRGHYWSVLFMAPDRIGLLSKILGVLALHNVQILAAQIFTMKDGTAVDVLDVSPVSGTCIEPEDWDRIKHDLGLALSDKMHLPSRLARKHKPVGTGQHHLCLKPKAKVVVDNESSDFYTIVEIHAEDRPGLLFDITRTFCDMGVGIYRAKIGTSADQVVDVFYVLDRVGQKLTEKDFVTELENALLYAAGCAG